MNFQRREIHFSGRVQGVGFRFTTQRIAANHDVTGFVQNLRDGRVLLVAEGTRQEIDSFVTAIETSMTGHIKDVQSRKLDYIGEFEGFSITRVTG